MSLPDEKQVERALRYLEESEEAYAQAVAAKEAADLRLKVARDVAFLEHEGTVAERTAAAGSCDAYLVAIDGVERAYTDAELLKAKRQRALLVCEVWRSLNSNRRAGIV
jgi:hypothetical protein